MLLSSGAPATLTMRPEFHGRRARSVDLGTVEYLAFEQPLRHAMQEVDVALQQAARALVAVDDDAAHFVIDLDRGAFRVVLGLGEIAPEKNLFFLLAEGHRPELFTHPPLAHHAARQSLPLEVSHAMRRGNEPSSPQHDRTESPVLLIIAGTWDVVDAKRCVTPSAIPRGRSSLCSPGPRRCQLATKTAGLWVAGCAALEVMSSLRSDHNHLVLREIEIEHATRSFSGGSQSAARSPDSPRRPREPGGSGEWGMSTSAATAPGQWKRRIHSRPFTSTRGRRDDRKDPERSSAEPEPGRLSPR